MGGPRNAAYIWTIVALAIVACLALVPTPYYLLAPGSAVELAARIAVRAHRAPARRFFLTDVTVARASVLLLGGALLPDTRVVRRDAVVPAGVSARTYDRVLVDAMADSQNVAALVAERAAGYRVDVPPARIVVADIVAGSRATGVLRRGDRVVRVADRPIRRVGDVARALGRLPPGTPVRLAIDRDGAPLAVVVPTMAYGTTSRLGISLRERVRAARLPVPVRFDLGDIAGSSGGLMFGLEIYAALRAPGGGEDVAGTGTLAADGRVGRIEGTRQKLVAAKRAGARVFLVPKENYADIAGDRDVRVVPVATFGDALRAIGDAAR
ncbi:MAG: protease DdcP [Vulcanimicrobiaceae bacterium]